MLKVIKSNLNDINKILNSYTEEIQDGIVSAAEELADYGVKKLKNTKGTYKVRTGDYNKSWTKKVDRGKSYVHATIHNKKHYRLTHLLEDGHVTRNGKRTKAYKHISPVNDEIQKKYLKKVEDIIGGLK